MQKPKDNQQGEISTDVHIMLQFREGVKRLCGLRIWACIARWFDIDVTTRGAVNDLATKLHVSPPIASEGLNHGGLSLQLLVAAMADRQKQYKDLGQLPDPRILFVSGYQCAIRYVQHSVLKREGDNGQLDLQQFCVLCNFLDVLTGRDARELLVINDWPDGRKRAITTQVNHATADRLGLERHAVSYSWEALMSLRSRWGRAVGPCASVIPDGWWKWIESASDAR
jgi:hypothetical protein